MENSGGPPRGGFRGRGAPGRGGFDGRGRGRGGPMGRGGGGPMMRSGAPPPRSMGGMGRGGPMNRGRGRGGFNDFNNRPYGPPQNSNGPPPPQNPQGDQQSPSKQQPNQAPKQQNGSAPANEPPAKTTGPASQQPATQQQNQGPKSQNAPAPLDSKSSSGPQSGSQPPQQVMPIQTSNSGENQIQSTQGSRSRGGFNDYNNRPFRGGMNRGRGRGNFNDFNNRPFRGGMNRGRGNYNNQGSGGGFNQGYNQGSGFNQGYNQGGYSQPPPRQQFDTRQPSNTTTVTPVKRGAPSGPPGPKRGRYDSGPPSRNMPPKPMAPHQAPPQQFNGPMGYQDVSQHPPMDQYGGYNNPPPQNNYSGNGYGQGSYGNAPVPPGYSQPPEYEQNHYADYSQPGYDQRNYQGGYQDYGQQYGGNTDYSQVPQDSYSSQQYDDRSGGYGGYDAQAYNQAYAKPDQYSHGGYY